MKKAICIIPARSGSKRIKNKNIRIFHNKPIIYYSIRSAKKTKLFNKIYVSTDSKKIEKIAEKYGATSTGLRLKKLSNDTASTFSVIKNFTINFKIDFKYLVCIYPATPTLDYKDILRGFNLISKNKNIDVVIPVSKFNSHPFRSLIIKNKKIKPQNNENFRKNTNSLTELFFDTGSFYIIRKKFILESNNFFPSNALPLIIKKYKYVDINDNEDFEVANKIFKKN